MKKATSQALLIVLTLLLSVISSYAKIPDIVLKQKKAVVTIFVNDKDGKKISSGTGFIIDPKGVIATNYHVVSEWLKVLDNTLIIKMENGAYFPIDDLISFDEDNDIAIFKVEAKELPTIKLIKDAKAKQGDSVVVIGSPLGMETTVSDGIISSIRKKGELIQITAPVSPGSSGSPVFNIKGDVIGVATFLIEGGQNLNFAIPVRYIAALTDEYSKLRQKVKFESELKDDLEEAKNHVKNNPNNASAYLLLGVTYADLDKDTEAIEAYKKALSINPKYAVAYLRLGNAYANKRMYKEAEEVFKKLLRLKPTHPSAHSRLALVYFSLNRYKDAIEECKEAIKIKTDDVNNYLLCGSAYLSLGMRKEAIAMYRRVQEIEPDNAAGLFAIGAIYGESGEYLEAIRALREVIRINPGNALAYYSLGFAYDSAKVPTEAAYYYKESLKINPDYAMAHFNLGRIYVQWKEMVLAEDEYNKLKSLDPRLADELYKQIQASK